MAETPCVRGLVRTGYSVTLSSGQDRPPGNCDPVYWEISCYRILWSGVQLPPGSRLHSDRSGPAGGTQAGADPECDGRHNAEERQQGGGPGQNTGHKPGDEGGPRRVNCVNEPEPAAHEIAREDETDGTGGNGEQKLEHKAVLERVS